MVLDKSTDVLNILATVYGDGDEEDGDDDDWSGMNRDADGGSGDKV